MEVQLNEIIEQIKKDGVDAAEEQSRAIVEEARLQAQSIVSDARTQADKMLSEAKREADDAVRAGEEALRQAGRNLLISFRESVARELEAIAADAVSAVYSSDELLSLIVKAIESRAASPDTEDITVLLGEDDLARLEQSLYAALKKKMLGCVTLKTGDSFDSGFRIAAGEGGVYYDYSADAVVEMLSNYLSPRVRRLLREAEL